MNENVELEKHVPLIKLLLAAVVMANHSFYLKGSEIYHERD